MAERKHRLGIITHYQKIAMERTGRAESLNRNTAQWAADNLVESYGYPDCKKLIERYFDVVQPPHSWKWFTNNADRLYDGWQMEKDDHRAREVMKRRMKEWLSE